MGKAFLLLWCIFAMTPFSMTQPQTCPKEYLRFSQEHSFCKPKNPTCDIQQTGLSEADKTLVLNLHNSFRSVIATAQDNSRSLPSASDMLEMEWDDELASVAQAYATQCLFAHDPADSRRVVNFGVGQNLATQTISGFNVPAPKPDWNFSVSGWFEEIVYFNLNNICNFGPGTTGEYRHFTQLIWSSTYRVGCGYTLYKTSDNTWHRLYVCNYGPMGNIYGSCVYKQGLTCSQCPINTACKSYNAKSPGLCTRINDKPPQLPMTQPTLLHCDFMPADKEDCLTHVEGPNNWKIVPALGGHFLEALLYPGQNSTITLSKSINPSSETFCVLLNYRKGPNVAGQLENNEAKMLMVIPSMNDYKFTQDLPSYPAESRHQFSSYKLTLQWKHPTFMSINFYVPMNDEPQFINIKSIAAYDGRCPN